MQRVRSTVLAVDDIASIDPRTKKQVNLMFHRPFSSSSYSRSGPTIVSLSPFTRPAYRFPSSENGPFNLGVRGLRTRQEAAGRAHSSIEDRRRRRRADRPDVPAGDRQRGGVPLRRRGYRPGSTRITSRRDSTMNELLVLCEEDRTFRAVPRRHAAEDERTVAEGGGPRCPAP